MDTRYPHPIVSGEEVARMPPEVQRHFRPLTKAKAAMLVGMTPEQRGQWLQANPIDRDLVERIRKEEHRMARKLRRLGAAAIPAKGSKRDPERPHTITDLVREALGDQREQREDAKRAREHVEQADRNDLGAETSGRP